MLLVVRGISPLGRFHAPDRMTGSSSRSLRGMPLVVDAGVNPIGP